MGKQWPAWLPLNKRLAPLTPYGAPQIENVVSLNTNENPFDLPADVVSTMSARVAQVLPHLNRYPDRDAITLRVKLLTYLQSHSHCPQLTVDNIFVANGSNEILQNLALSFGDRGAIGFLPSYSMHPLIAEGTGVQWTSGKRNADFSFNADLAIEQIRTLKPSLIFITTPNNPTGHPVDLEEIRRVAHVVTEIGSLLIVDEAYAEFSSYPSALTLMKEFDCIVVVRTMSKAFSLAGARVGYIAAHHEVVNGLLLTRLPYHLSAQTQAIALAALECESQLLSQVEYLKNERDRVAHELTQMGFSVLPSAANFLLFSGFESEPKLVWQGVLDAGVLIRDVGIPGFLRVTIGKSAENDQFLAAILPFAP